MELTAAQNSAVLAKNPELLVSAAAGSGKTAVLIERIVGLLQKEGYSIDRMLICTFTHAAASEMRERLETRLMEAGIKNKAMQRQADLVENAQISTLHSFCQKIVRGHFETVSIDPQASLCDEATRARLKQAAIQQCLDESYELALAEDGADIAAFLQRFSENEAAATLDALYEFLMAQPTPFDWLMEHAAHQYTERDFERGPLAETLLSDCRVLLDGALAFLDDAKLLQSSPHLREGYAQNMAADERALIALGEAASQSLKALMGEASKISFERLATYRLADPEEMAVRDEFKALRERYKGLVAEMRGLLPADAAMALADLNAMQPALMGLAKMAKRAHDIFMGLKSHRNVIDFSDLEHMALAVLSRPELQRKIAGQYDAVFVDEYQDISAVQEAILNGLRPPFGGFHSFGSFPPFGSFHSSGGASPPNAPNAPNTSRPNLRFYVGDVKQSIYRFRQADPTLFLEKERLFRTEEEAPQRKIALNRNFRSRESVLNAVNRVFAHVMRPEVTELAYGEEAMLYPGQPSQGDEPTLLHVLDGKGLRAAERPAAEAALIAAEINRRVGTPFVDRDGNESGRWHYRDMVILMPAAKGIAPIVEKTLAQAGVPVYTEDGQASLESIEIRQALAHLRLLDNLRDDLSLLAALRGPVYAMTEEELARIRLHRPQKEASFLDALMAAAKEAQDPALAARCKRVLDDLAHEQFLERSMPLDEYLWSFLSRSGLYGFYGAQPGGRLKQANLRMLCSRASEHMRVQGGALRDFLASVTAISGVRDAGSPTILGPSEDVVRVMTIHKSKGLEFPLVFVMGLGSALHGRQSGGGPLSMHPRLGVALKYVNPRARTTRGTLLGSAIALRRRAEEKAERARVLYVAMTRAREQLIAIGTGSEKLSTAYTRKTTHGEAYLIWEAKSMLEWLCQCVQNTDDVRIPDGTHFSTPPLWETQTQTAFSTKSTYFPQKTGVWRVVFHIDKDKSTVPGIVENEEPEKPNQQAENREKPFESLLSEALRETTASDAAPGSHLAPSLSFSHAPLKLGVTAFLRSLSGEERALPGPQEEDAERIDTKRLPLPLTRPRLLSDLPTLPGYLRGPEEQMGLVRGIATHKALSLLPFAPLAEQLGNTQEKRKAPKGPKGPKGLEGQIERELGLLQGEGRLSAEERALVDVGTLAQFFLSPIGQRALRAKEVHREWSFNLRAPDLCESILQGVIDLCFREDGGWTLVDYKTDRVSSAEELWKTYGRQMDIYCRALVAATGRPIREAALFALALGESHSQIQETRE